MARELAPLKQLSPKSRFGATAPPHPKAGTHSRNKPTFKTGEPTNSILLLATNSCGLEREASPFQIFGYIFINVGDQRTLSGGFRIYGLDMHLDYSKLCPVSANSGHLTIVISGDRRPFPLHRPVSLSSRYRDTHTIAPDLHHRLGQHRVGR